MKQQSKALHLAHIVDLRVIGGIERMAQAFVSALPEHQHSLVVFDRQLHPSINQNLAHLPNVNIISSKHWGMLRLPKSWRTWRRNQIISALAPDAIINWSQIIDMRAFQKPVVFYEHGSAWEVFDENVLAACYDKVHHGIAVSHAAKRMLQLHHGFGHDIDVVHNTVLQTPDIQAQARHLPVTRPFVLGAAGRLVGRKNFGVLIAAVAQLNKQGVSVHLKIAGDGPQRASLQQWIAHLNVSQQVTLLGHVHDMADFYQSIDVFVCPSIWESYGLVAIEAFAHGVPVVGAACDGLVEVVKNGVNGLVVKPTWNEKQATEQLSGLAAFESSVSYDAQTDRLQAPHSMSVEQLSIALSKLLQDASLYEHLSLGALQTAKDIKSFNRLVAEVVESVKKAIDA